MNKSLAIALIAIVALLMGLAIAPYVEQYIFPITGEIHIEYYLTNIIEDIVHANGTQLQYGSCAPGNQYAVNLTVVNISPVNVTVFALTPSIPAYLTMSWTHNNTQLDAGQTASADLILDVDPAAPDEAIFNYNLIVAAEEIP